MKTTHNIWMDDVLVSRGLALTIAAVPIDTRLLNPTKSVLLPTWEHSIHCSLCCERSAPNSEHSWVQAAVSLCISTAKPDLGSSSS